LKRFFALGTECAEYLKVAKASEGTLFILFFAFPLDFFFCWLFDFLSFFAGLQLQQRPMPVLHHWKPSSALRRRPTMLRPPPKQMLRSRKNQRWLRRKTLKKLWPMPTKSILSENKP
jgi:hypothetical protein